MASEADQNQPTKKPTLADNHGEEDEDFISRLPDTILHMILSKLEMRDAAVTTAVSKRWAPVFTTLPSLKIDGNSFNPRVLAYPDHWEPYVEDADKWMESLFSVLDSRKTPIEKFEIDVGIFAKCDGYFHVVFRELCGAGVKELLILNNAFDHIYDLPSPVFSCNTIVNLELLYCSIEVPSKLTGLRSVKSLKLRHVTVADIDLRRMISRCNAMEKLVITDCNKVENIVIRGPSLLELVINFCRPVGISLKSVPRLAFVEVSLIYDYNSWFEYYASFEERFAAREDSDEDFFTYCSNDNSFRDTGKTFEGTNEATNLMAFLNRIRSVKDLRLNFSNEYRAMLSKEGIALPTRLSPKCYLVELRKLQLSWPSNYHTFNTLVSCLLNSSPHLMEIIICVDASSDDKYRHFALELDFWDKQLPAECVKHHMTTATFYYGYISEDCFGFPKFLLLNARNLKNMNIFYTGKLKDKPETADKIKHEVLAVQQASPDVEMTIKPLISRFQYSDDDGDLS
ncbi:F-box/RNI-like/FBD-like domains-containing protein [Rhynchospora pubera]|uniref:F-box/RNI-like/FBD-like domains-containing protein n=1 Tax=Rhynchospora pubera TaxID=906938 RepID=A0AAV8FAD3_9POAL|nr:F-box/RNI-like/FBD-like domains-containing protein [Rhynchospora pubera]